MHAINWVLRPLGTICYHKSEWLELVGFNVIYFCNAHHWFDSLMNAIFGDHHSSLMRPLKCKCALNVSQRLKISRRWRSITLASMANNEDTKLSKIGSNFTYQSLLAKIGYLLHLNLSRMGIYLFWYINKTNEINTEKWNSMEQDRGRKTIGIRPIMSETLNDAAQAILLKVRDNSIKMRKFRQTTLRFIDWRKCFSFISCDFFSSTIMSNVRKQWNNTRLFLCLFLHVDDTNGKDEWLSAWFWHVYIAYSTLLKDVLMFWYKNSQLMQSRNLSRYCNFLLFTVACDETFVK